MTTILLNSKEKNELNTIVFVCLFLFFAIIFFPLQNMWGYYNDWAQVFYVSGKMPLSPYFGYYVNTPWMAVVLAPFSLSTWQLGQSLWMAFSFTIIAHYLIKRGASPISLILVMTSSFAIEYLRAGQIDAIILLGYMMLEDGKRFSFVPLLVKPQLFIFSFVGKLKNKQWVFRTAFDGAVFFILSLAVWGNWIHDMYNAIVSSLVTGTNISPFPYLIPIGINLLYQSYKKQDIMYGAFATLFLTPYILIHSLVIHFAILATKIKIKYQIAIYIIGWVYFIYSKGLL